MLLYGAFLSRLVLAVQPYFEVYSYIHNNIKYLLWELCVVCRHFAFPRKRFPEFLVALFWRPQRSMGVYWTHHLRYTKWNRRVEGLGHNWGDNTGGIWNVLCKTISSNFWTQRTFCSPANKYFRAAFSSTAQNRCALVREVRILYILESCNRPPQIDQIW